MPLKIAIIGAGIGGLSAAITLNHAGHSVTVFEKSTFASEIGAAISLSPNGARVLASFGFSFEKARTCKMSVYESVDGCTLQPLSSFNLNNSMEKYGQDYMSIHRADLHNELLRLAFRSSANPIKLRTGLTAEAIATEQDGVFAIKLSNGRTMTADLIIGADGVHSGTRSTVLGPESSAVHAITVTKAFRFTIPTRKLESVNDLAQLRTWKSAGITVFADTAETQGERHLVWYHCRGGEIQNLVGVYPTSSELGYNENAKDALLAQFDHFHPDVVKLLRLAEHITRWELPFYEPFPRWSNGNVVLIGDAAHPMLPFSGQGANQALEDAGALGILFKNVASTSDITDRLRLFEDLKRKRTSIIQILSSVRIGKEHTVKDKLNEFAEPGTNVPTNFTQRVEHALEYKVLEACNEALKAFTTSLT